MNLTVPGDGWMENGLITQIVAAVVAGVILLAITGVWAYPKRLISQWFAARKADKAAAAAEEKAREEARRAAEAAVALERKSRLDAVRSYLDDDVLPILIRAGVAAGGQPGAVETYWDPEGIRRELDRLRDVDVKKIHTEKYHEVVGERREAQKQSLLGNGYFVDLGKVREFSQREGVQIKARLEVLAEDLDDHELQERMRALGDVLADDTWQRMSAQIGSARSAVHDLVNGLIEGQETMTHEVEAASRAASGEPAAMQELARHREHISGLAAKVVERLDRIAREQGAFGAEVSSE